MIAPEQVFKTGIVSKACFRQYVQLQVPSNIMRGLWKKQCEKPDFDTKKAERQWHLFSCAELTQLPDLSRLTPPFRLGSDLSETLWESHISLFRVA